MSSGRIDVNNLLPTELMRGEDSDETELLKQMLEEAADYVSDFEWCPAISSTFWGFGVGGVVAVFLFEFDSEVKGTDRYLWVIVGDIPCAYLVTDAAPNPEEALGEYCQLMEEWANAILEGSPSPHVFPVSAPPTRQYAEMLLSRLGFIRKEIIPLADKGPRHRP
jgi:hypothetical protein